MKINEAWLRDLVGEKLSCIDIDDVLTKLGLEVDKVDPVGDKDTSGLVCCLIKEIQRHPKNPNLNVCVVETHIKDNIIVVCGASNIFVGAKAILAPVDALIAESKVQSKDILGVISHGFLCSAEELGLEGQSEGIMLLPQDCELGADIRKAMELSDNILDIDLTPNRGDCFSAYGIVRELYAYLNLAFYPEFKPPVKIDNPQKELKVAVADPIACPRYSVALLEGVNNNTVLPIKITERLRRAGIQSVNPVVDITNYIMLKTGQPMHAFDAAQLSGNCIHVRKASSTEELKLLNNETIKLDNESLIITCDKKVLALGGIMGGLSSSVSSKTQSIVIESAYFTPLSIAMTARKHNIQTDASTRFERGVDPNLCNQAINDAINSIIKFCGAHLIFQDVVSSDEHFPKVRTVLFRPSKAAKVIGVNIPSDNIKKILTNLGFQIEVKTTDLWKLTIPSHRFDIEMELDIVEEIVRFFGVDNVPNNLPSIKLRPRKNNANLYRENKIRSALSASGFNEIVSYSFVSKSFANLFSALDVINLKNPISMEMDTLRPTIFSSMFPAILHNISRQIDQINFFEIGKVFFKKGVEDCEVNMLAACRYGRISGRHWCQETRDSDFFDAKNDLSSLFLNCFDILLNFEPKEFIGFHPGQSAQVNYQDSNVGLIGCVHPDIAKKYNLSLPLYFFEIDLSFFELINRKRYVPISKYPTIKRDISIVIPAEINADTCIKEIEKLNLPLLKNLELFDVYTGQGIDPSKKSFSLGLIFQSSRGTLTDIQVDEFVDLVIRKLNNVFGAQLRE